MPGYTTTNHLSAHHVAKILEIYPMHDYTCVGYAESKHRRCHNPISASNARAASELLTTIAHAMASKCSLDELLENLAHLVLCRRWHQNQATALSSAWNAQIDKFQARSTSTLMIDRFERQSQQQSRINPRRVEISQYTRAVTVSVQPRPRTPGHSPVITQAAGSHSHPLSPASATHQVSPRRGEPVLNESDTRSDITSPSSRPRTSPSQPRGSSSNSSSAPTPKPSIATSRNANKATRRSVEDDCGICLMPLLHKKIHDKSDGKVKEAATKESENDPQLSHPAAPDGTSVKDKEHVALNDLDWCKGQCGTNYHKNCINEWVKVRKNSTNGATCPTCRGAWK